MQTSYCYLPILRARGGVFRAISSLSPLALSRLTPIFDVPHPILGPSQTMESYLRKRAAGIYRCWGPRRPVYLDVYDFPVDAITENGAHPIRWLTDQFKARGGRPIPVAGTLGERDSSYLYAIRSFLEGENEGVCLRLERDELDDLELLRSSLTSTLDFLKATPEKVDLVLDYRYVGADRLENIRSKVGEALLVIGDLGSFRNVSFAGGSVPEHLPKKDQGKIRRERRIEFQAWVELLGTGYGNALAISDFGVVSPFYVQPGRRVNIPSRVRYTTAADHIFLRAERHERPVLCRQMAGLPDFSGDKFSVGDQNIANSAAGLLGQGNAANWLADDLIHHLEFVSAQSWRALEDRGLQTRFAVPAPIPRPWLQNNLGTNQSGR